MPNEQDVNFVKLAAESGLVEIAAGELAIERAPEPAVSEYGLWMKTDHTLVNTLVGNAAEQAGIPVPTEIPPDQQAKLDELAGLEGKAFSDAYITEQVVD